MYVNINKRALKQNKKNYLIFRREDSPDKISNIMDFR